MVRADQVVGAGAAAEPRDGEPRGVEDVVARAALELVADVARAQDVVARTAVERRTDRRVADLLRRDHAVTVVASTWSQPVAAVAPAASVIVTPSARWKSP